MEQFKEWAESELRISQLKDMPVHIKRKVYRIYRNRIFEQVYAAVTRELKYKDSKDLFKFYNNYVNIHNLEIGDRWCCASISYPFSSIDLIEEKYKEKGWRYLISKPEINMNEVLKNKTYRGKRFGSIWGLDCPVFERGECEL